MSRRTMVFRYRRQLTGIVGLARLAQAECAGIADVRSVRLAKRVKRKVVLVSDALGSSSLAHPIGYSRLAWRPVATEVRALAGPRRVTLRFSRGGVTRVSWRHRAPPSAVNVSYAAAAPNIQMPRGRAQSGEYPTAQGSGCFRRCKARSWPT